MLYVAFVLLLCYMFVYSLCFVFFFKQKTAYEMRISDWSSDVCSSDLVDFLVELSRRLHAYGTTAQRLEGAISAVARRLGLECDPWSNPTGLILTFADPDSAELTPITRVIRLVPGDEIGSAHV